jgi:hypothetical protein
MQQPDNVFEFFKLLIEFGGVHYVNDDKFVCNVIDDKPVLININNKGTPLMVFHNNMVAGEYTIFNPLVEPLGPSSERAWFFQRNSLIIGNMVKALIRKAAELAQSSEKCYDKLDLIQPYFSAMDKKFLAEVDKLKPSDIMRIFYHKKRKVAQLQTELFEDDHFKGVSKTFRKRSRDAIRGLIGEFMGTDEISKVYKYKATHIGMQEADASIHVLVKAGEALHQYVSLLLDKDLHVPELMLHLESLEKYHKQCIWFANANTRKEDEAIPSNPAPWDSPLPSKSLPGMGSSLPRMARSAADMARIPTFPPMQPQLQPSVMPGYAPQTMHQPTSVTGLPLNAHAPGTMPQGYPQPGMGMAPQMGMIPHGISPFASNVVSPYASPIAAPGNMASRLNPTNLTPGSTTPDSARLPQPKI